ncbi:DUF721 domain-containing protein [Propionibacteriaceae bacterium G57]|uniref:DUF721 domain-containing protein n=1 Tax=Aestuariimicrobium sp. G57 TaxID=3418485 RepID=UPI003DA7A28A
MDNFGDNSFTGTERPDSADEPGLQDDDRDLLARHDATGIDLATAVAHQTAASGPSGVNLPPPRGVRTDGPGTSRRRRRSWGPAQFSSARPDDRDPQPLASVLGDLVRRRGWSTQLNLRTLLLQWADLVGPTNAAHSTPEGFKDGVLTIRTESTTWATALRAIAPNLLAELNGRLGDGSVTRILVLGPEAPSWKHGIRSVRDGRGPRDTYG